MPAPLPCPCLLHVPQMQALNPFGSAHRTFRYWEEPELVDLVNTVGLTDYRKIRSRMYIMFAATKPEMPQW